MENKIQDTSDEFIKKSYYAIIPANVRYDEKLTANAKLLYGEITALCNEKGFCWATNNYFSKLYNVSKVSISTWISQLKKRGYISIELIYQEGSKQILYRYLRIVNEPIKENFKIPNKENFITPIKENFKDNITSSNITKSNNTINIKNEISIHDEKHANIESKLYTGIIELFYKGCQELYDDKPIINKTFGNIVKNIIKVLLEIDSVHPELSLKKYFSIYYKICKDEKGGFWKLTPDQFLWGLSNNKFIGYKSNKIDTAEDLQKAYNDNSFDKLRKGLKE